MGNISLGSQDSASPISGAAIIDGSITSDELGTGSVTSVKLASSAVTNEKLASNAVTAAKIASGTITLAELAQSLREYLVPIGAVLPFGGGTAPAGYVLCDGGLHNASGTCSLCGLVHPDLASVLSNTYGGTLGSTFRVPDLRGRIPMGAGTGAGNGASGNPGTNPAGTTLTARARGQWSGSESEILTTTHMPSHNHGGATRSTQDTYGYNPMNHSHGMNGAGAHNHNTGARNAFSQGGTVYNGIIRATADFDSDSVMRGVGDHTHAIHNANIDHVHSIVSEGGGVAHNNIPPFVAVNYIIKAI